MKVNIEKVLSFIIELARLFLSWKKGGTKAKVGNQLLSGANHANSALPGGDGDSAGLHRGAALATSEAGGVNPAMLGYGVRGTGYGEKEEASPTQPPATAEAEDPHTPSPVPRPPNPVNLVGWGLMVYAGIRLLAQA
jgi:hypothetical protein